MSPSNLHIAWAELFLHAAAASGVTDVIVSPGSRSTPLAIAAAMSAALRTHVIVDERSAAFFALGQARVTGRPSLLICTSGTAGAHYLPAVIEAHQSFVPLIAVTADRPWELHDVAASQTVNQLALFGSFTRHFAELGLPDSAPSALAAVPRIAAQAVASSRGPLPGPVHVNARFRKPLEPVADPGPEPWMPAWEALMKRGPSVVHAPRMAPDDRAVIEIAERASRTSRGLIVCGPAPLASAEGRAAILDLARATGFPLLPEGTSQLRFGGDREGVTTVGSFDAILRAPEFRAAHAPDLILELGAPPTSAGYAVFLAEHPAAARVVVAPHGWNDPTSSAAAFVLADPAELARRVAVLLPRRAAPSRWAASFARASLQAAAFADAELARAGLSEGAIARAIVAACPDGALLAIGNSTPVRDLDAWCPPEARSLGVLHQRGASGIDGLLSGAAGAHSVASGPVVLLLGDLSLLHDIGALGLLRKTARPDRPLVVVVVQNGGGRIFDHLPVAERAGEALFERYFATPEDVRFDAAAAAFGVRFSRAGTHAELDVALSQAFDRGGATLIEAVAPPRAGAARLAKLWSVLRAELALEPSPLNK